MPGDPGSLLEVLWQDADAARVVLDEQGRIAKANAAARLLLVSYRLSIGDPIRGVFDAVFGDDGQALPLDRWPADAVMQGQPIPRTTVTARFSGTRELRRLVYTSQPITDLGETGSGAGVLVAWWDVTDSWHTEQRNATALSRLGQLLEGASDHAIIMLDAYGRIQTWSASAQRLMGYTESEAVGMPYSSFFDESERRTGIPDALLRTAVATGRAVAEGKRVRKDGSMFWAHAVLTAMRDDDGQLRGFVKVTQDVSEHRATQQAVVQLNAELQQINGQLEQRVAQRTAQLERQAADLAAVNAELEAFSYSVSHDLRAPLRAMSGFARILLEEFGADLPDRALGYIGRVQENAVQMGSLIDALLAFSRMQRQELDAGLLDMNALVSSCWESLAPARSDRSIQLALGDLPPAAGDTRLIQQVWLNLLDNAIKYTGRTDDARVEVNGDTDGTEVSYWVTDNGAGFDMRYADKIGQVFQRLHRNEDFSGTGIGLALAQRIVTRHGGRLTAHGEPGAGAVMGFTLPVQPGGELAGERWEAIG